MLFSNVLLQCLPNWSMWLGPTSINSPPGATTVSFIKKRKKWRKKGLSFRRHIISPILHFSIGGSRLSLGLGGCYYLLHLMKKEKEIGKLGENNTEHQNVLYIIHELEQDFKKEEKIKENWQVSLLRDSRGLQATIIRLT